MEKQYDVAAYIWPAYTGDEPRTRMFWREGIGEWQSVKNSAPKENGYYWHRKPLWGYQNEADPTVMEMQIEEATSHGVNVFIYDWYWYDNKPFLEECLDNGFLKARNNHKMKFYLMWANHTAHTMWYKPLSDLRIPVWDGAQDRKTFEFLVDRTIEKYFKHPSYYKINGKPVYMIFNIHDFVRGLGGTAEAKDAIEYFRRKTVEAGFPGLELQMCIKGKAYSELKMIDGTTIKDFVNDAGFDSGSLYQYRDLTATNCAYPDIVESALKEYEEIASELKLTAYPHVSVGWDSNPRYNKFHDDVCYDNTPENVRAAFEKAKKYIDEHPELPVPLITVNSWNEWTETSYLHPDDLYGYGYLEAIRSVFVDGE
jgi:hypothetical protein